MEDPKRLLQEKVRLEEGRWGMTADDDRIMFIHNEWPLRDPTRGLLEVEESNLHGQKVTLAESNMGRK